MSPKNNAPGLCGDSTRIFLSYTVVTQHIAINDNGNFQAIHIIHQPYVALPSIIGLGFAIW
jgi:hypothetical protein